MVQSSTMRARCPRSQERRAPRWSAVELGLLLPVLVAVVGPLGDPRTALAEADRFHSQVVAVRARVLPDALQAQGVLAGVGPEVEQVELLVGHVGAVEVQRLAEL